MKRNFSQPFKSYTLASLIVEVEDGEFLHFAWDEDYAHFAGTLEFPVSERKDFTLQLAQFLYGKGLAVDAYRELARETSVSYSFVDKTPGEALTDVCFYVRAARTDQEIEGEPSYLSFDAMAESFKNGINVQTIVLLGLARLYVERSFTRGLSSED